MHTDVLKEYIAFMCKSWWVLEERGALKMKALRW